VKGFQLENFKIKKGREKVKNRIIFISLAVALALSVGLIGCGGGEVPGIPEQPTTLIIGMARDTNEDMAIFEMAYGGVVVREFVEQVNLAGGVHLSAYDTPAGECYVPLEIDRREINVATWDIGKVTAEICADISNGDVHFLIGGYPNNDLVIAQAAIANEAGVVLLTL